MISLTIAHIRVYLGKADVIDRWKFNKLDCGNSSCNNDVVSETGNTPRRN